MTVVLLLALPLLAEASWKKLSINSSSALELQSLDYGSYHVKLQQRTNLKQLRKHRFNSLSVRHRQLMVHGGSNGTALIGGLRKEPVEKEHYKLHLTDKQSEYTAPIDIGGQKLNCIYDTGSAMVWVYSSLCNSDICRRHLNRGSRFDLEQADKAFSPSDCYKFVQFGTGSLRGQLGTDDIHLDSLQLPGAGFGMIKHTDDNPVFTLDFDGICGVSYKMEEDSCYNEDGKLIRTSLLQNLQASNLAYKTMTFSFDGSGGGDLSIGSPPLETAIAVPVTTKFYWETKLMDIKVGGRSLFAEIGWHDPNVHKAQVMFDTGTSVFTMPFDAYTTVHKMAGCDGKGGITYVLGDGREVHINNWFQQMGESCTPLVMDLDIRDQNLFILGQPFFDEHITTFDAGRNVIWISPKNK